ncbi:hypothetical protein, partial [Rhizobacter sp. SG703]|uniref:hypothetical protein n=1 Tax=Rhizobacter sp. SG703 TaxID=2587140 RepID=UPI001B2FF30B
ALNLELVAERVLHVDGSAHPVRRSARFAHSLGRKLRFVASESGRSTEFDRDDRGPRLSYARLAVCRVGAGAEHRLLCRSKQTLKFRDRPTAIAALLSLSMSTCKQDDVHVDMCAES